MYISLVVSNCILVVLQANVQKMNVVGVICQFKYQSHLYRPNKVKVVGYLMFPLKASALRNLTFLWSSCYLIKQTMVTYPSNYHAVRSSD